MNTIPGDFSHMEGWPENQMECTDEERLLNAFQLVKNGKKISHMKFEEFKKLMEKKHDHNGNIIKGEKYMSDINDLTIDGDLNQMALQSRFLTNSGFSLKRANVYSIVEGMEVVSALEAIWNNNIPGWWHYLDKYVEHNICTKEEFDTKLNRSA